MKSDVWQFGLLVVDLIGARGVWPETLLKRNGREITKSEDHAGWRDELTTQIMDGRARPNAIWCTAAVVRNPLVDGAGEPLELDGADGKGHLASRYVCYQ